MRGEHLTCVGCCVGNIALGSSIHNDVARWCKLSGLSLCERPLLLAEIASTDPNDAAVGKAASVLWQPAAMGQSERRRGLVALSCFHLSFRQRKQYQAVLLARASSHSSSSMRAAGNLWRRYGKCSTAACVELGP